jgi:hypothetical protein
MKPAKQFDCVAMKNAIQAKHRRQRRGLSDEQVRQAIAQRLASSDDPLARRWRELAESSSTRTVGA